MRALLAALLCLGFASPAAADRFAMRYEASAFGVMPLGGIRVDADVSEDSYRIDAGLRSRGLLSLFERTQLTAEARGLIENGVVQWRAYDLDHQYSRKHRSTALRRGEDGRFSAEIIPIYRVWGEPPVSAEQIARSRDPLSTMMAMAVDVGQSRRCAGAYPTFDGRFHYLLELGGGEIGDHDGGGYEGPVLRCTLSYIAVSGFEARDGGRRRIPHGRIWFALVEDSRFAPPVRITTPAATGGVVVRLTQFNRARVDVTMAEAP